MSYLVFLVATIWLLDIEEDTAPTALPRVVLPIAKSGTADTASEPHPRVVVTITERGSVIIDERHSFLDNRAWCESVRAKAGNSSVSLERLAQLLFMMREQYIEVLRKKGRSGTEKWRVGDLDFEVCKRKVLLRIDKDAPWGHVLWVATVCTETKFWRFQLGVKRRADRSYTKQEAERIGVEASEKQAPDAQSLEAKLDVPLSREFLSLKKSMLSIITLQASWESDSVVRYRVGKRATNDVGEFRRWLAEEVKKRRATDRPVVIVPEIAMDVPTKFAVAVLDASYRTGAGVYWIGNESPDIEVRRRQKLPELPHGKKTRGK